MRRKKAIIPTRNRRRGEHVAGDVVTGEIVGGGGGGAVGEMIPAAAEYGGGVLAMLAAKPDSTARAIKISQDLISSWYEVVTAFLADIDISEISKDTYQTGVMAFGKYLRKESPDIIDKGVIVTWRDKMMNGGMSPVSVRGYLVSVKILFKWLSRRGIIPDVAADVRLPARKAGYSRRALSQEQAQRLAAYLIKESGANSMERQRNAALTLVALSCGLRVIELSRLRIGDIQERNGRRILTVQGKGKHAADDFIVLVDETHAVINAYLRRRKVLALSLPNGRLTDDMPLFSSLSPRNYAGRLTTRTISGVIKAALLAVSIDDDKVTAHSLRHTAACAILERGGGLEMAQNTLRHSSMSTTQIYTQSIKDNRRLKNAGEDLIRDFIFTP